LITAFEPYYNAIFSSDPSIIAGILVVLFSYSIISSVRRFNKTRAFVTTKKPSAVISEGFPDQPLPFPSPHWGGKKADHN
jgi:hypothetical protein